MTIQFNSLPVNAPLRITSRFGPRSTGIMGASTYHKGVDIGRDRKKLQTEILAVSPGTIASNYWNDVRGWVLIIDHNGYRTLYQHLKAQSPLQKGSKVSAGQIIGIMGASSKTIQNVAVHLHFELIINGAEVDPEPYLKNIVPVSAAAPKEQEDEDMIKYKKITDVPAWGQDAIKKVIAEGGLIPDEQGDINLTESMLRIYVGLYRMGKL